MPRAFVGLHNSAKDVLGSCYAQQDFMKPTR